MARMRFLCDTDRCIECNGCVTACKNENEVPWGINRRRVVTINDGQEGERSISGDGTTTRRDEQQSDLILRRAKGSGCARVCKSARCWPRLPWFAFHPHVVRVASVNSLVQLICWSFAGLQKRATRAAQGLSAL